MTTERFESVVLVAILLVVAGFAGAASFTHVHDWTMRNSPTGTPDWFGWANATISELVPTACALVIRRRRRTGQPVGYPLAVLVAAVGLSLAAQLAVAKPGPSGWLLSAVPAVAFVALTKLVLGTAPSADVKHSPAGDRQSPAEEITTIPTAPVTPPARVNGVVLSGPTRSGAIPSGVIR